MGSFRSEGGSEGWGLPGVWVLLEGRTPPCGVLSVYSALRAASTLTKSGAVPGVCPGKVTAGLYENKELCKRGAGQDDWLSPQP